MQFDQVSVGKKANVFFDGKCVSHTVTLPNGVRKSVGVVLPSTLRFDLSTKEVMSSNYNLREKAKVLLLQ